MHLRLRVRGLERGERAEFVLVLKVDLAGLHIALAGRDELRQRLLRAGKRGDHRGKCARARVGVPHVGEVEVSTELAADHAVRFGEHRLHENMADSAFDGLAAVLADDLGNAARTAQVVDHRRARLLRERVLHEPREQQVAADRRALLIEHNAAVGVAVEAEARVKLSRRHDLLQLAQVRLDERVGLMHELARAVVEVELLNHKTLHP